MTFIDFDICNLPATLPVLYSVTLTYFDYLLISHRSVGSCSLLWASLSMREPVVKDAHKQAMETASSVDGRGGKR